MDVKDWKTFEGIKNELKIKLYVKTVWKGVVI